MKEKSESSPLEGLRPSISISAGGGGGRGGSYSVVIFSRACMFSTYPGPKTIIDFKFDIEVEYSEEFQVQ